MKLITFDAAGTLIDHRWDPAGIARSAAEDHGIDVTESVARQAYAVVAAKHRPALVELESRGDRSGIDALWQLQMADWLAACGHEPGLAKEVLSRFRERAFGKDSFVWALYPDVLPALAACKGEGVTVGVISNWDHTLHGVLEHLGITSQFDFVIASLEFGHEKPDKRIYEEALRLGGATADESLHVGDSFEDDFVGATQAGWAALLIDRASAPKIDQHRISNLCQAAELLR